MKQDIADCLNDPRSKSYSPLLVLCVRVVGRFTNNRTHLDKRLSQILSDQIMGDVVCLIVPALVGEEHTTRAGCVVLILRISSRACSALLAIVGVVSMGSE